MKILLCLLLCSFVFITRLHSQCLPDFAYVPGDNENVRGIGIGNLFPACLGIPYHGEATILVPDFLDPIAGQDTVFICKYVLSSVEGLPNYVGNLSIDIRDYMSNYQLGDTIEKNSINRACLDMSLPDGYFSSNFNDYIYFQVVLLTSHSNDCNVLDTLNLIQINNVGVPSPFSVDFYFCDVEVDEFSGKVDDFELYPNPLNDEGWMSINLSSPGNLTISIIDTMGKTILKENRKGIEGVNHIPISARNLNPGLYTYTIAFKETLLKKKVLVY